MTTPARRCRGTSDIARVSAVNSRVPSSPAAGLRLAGADDPHVEVALDGRAAPAAPPPPPRSPARGCRSAGSANSSTTTTATSRSGERFSSTSDGLTRIASSIASASARQAVPRARRHRPERQHQHGRAAERGDRPPRQQRRRRDRIGAAAKRRIIALPRLHWPRRSRMARHVHLVGLVVAGQHVHHEVDAEPRGHLALRLAARDAGKGRPALVVDRPGAGPVVAADDDAGDAVIDAVLDRLDPQLPAGPAAGKLVQQIERLGQHVVGRHRHQRRDLDGRRPAGAAAPASRRRAAERAGRRVAGVAGVEQDRAAGLADSG